MKNCQATFFTPFEICQKWARFIRKVKLRKLIENTYSKNRLQWQKFQYCLNKETIFANGECRKNFNDTVRFLVEHYSNVRLASKKNGNCQKSSVRFY
jgi:hypothetical protein